MQSRAGLLALFEDKQLSAYVDKALEHNPDLKGSAARLEESGFEMRKASSSLVPAVDLNGGVSRSQNSIRNSRSRENLYSAGLDAQTSTKSSNPPATTVVDGTGTTYINIPNSIQ